MEALESIGRDTKPMDDAPTLPAGEDRVSTLATRFPHLDPSVILHALQLTKGHAGQAALKLQHVTETGEAAIAQIDASEAKAKAAEIKAAAKAKAKADTKAANKGQKHVPRRELEQLQQQVTVVGGQSSGMAFENECIENTVYVGVTFTEVDKQESVTVKSVERGSAAAKKGVGKGWTVQEVAGIEVKTVKDVTAALKAVKQGEKYDYIVKKVVIDEDPLHDGRPTKPAPSKPTTRPSLMHRLSSSLGLSKGSSSATAETSSLPPEPPSASIVAKIAAVEAASQGSADEQSLAQTKKFFEGMHPSEQRSFPLQLRERGMLLAGMSEGGVGSGGGYSWETYAAVFDPADGKVTCLSFCGSESAAAKQESKWQAREPMAPADVPRNVPCVPGNRRVEWGYVTAAGRRVLGW